jgi:hypothetical protein
MGSTASVSSALDVGPPAVGMMTRRKKVMMVVVAVVLMARRGEGEGR